MAPETIAWDRLHQDQRHNLVYPSEDVVRFLARIAAETEGRQLLDLGCGTGRHMELAAQLGWRPIGIDASFEVIKRAEWRHGVAFLQADMTSLPLTDAMFDAAIAHGSLYYSDIRACLRELHRVLRPGAYAFVTLRTMNDWRVDGVPDGEPEAGMPIQFLDEASVWEMFDLFGELRYELSEWTTHDRTRKNSDWLITVRR